MHEVSEVVNLAAPIASAGGAAALFGVLKLRDSWKSRALKDDSSTERVVPSNDCQSMGCCE
jgi:hypothetical protein